MRVSNSLFQNKIGSSSYYGSGDPSVFDMTINVLKADNGNYDEPC